MRKELAVMFLLLNIRHLYCSKAKEEGKPKQKKMPLFTCNCCALIAGASKAETVFQDAQISLARGIKCHIRIA